MLALLQGYTSSSLPGGLPAWHSFLGAGLPTQLNGAKRSIVQPASAQPATVYTNASAVWTAQAPGHRAEAFAVGADGRILVVGSTEACLAAAGQRAHVVDLAGRVVIPGEEMKRKQRGCAAGLWALPGTAGCLHGAASLPLVGVGVAMAHRSPVSAQQSHPCLLGLGLQAWSTPTST